MKLKSALSAPEGWETISAETHFEDAHLTVSTVEVRSPEGLKVHRWTVVRRKAAVVVAPLTADGKLVLIRQERVPIRAALWEVPAGQVDDANDTHTDKLAAVALRELREETGYELSEGGEVLPLGHFFSSPGFTDEQGFFFLARTVAPGASGSPPAESESILDCRAFGPEEIASMIATGEIRDANTLGICAKLIARGLLSLDAQVFSDGPA